MTIMDYPIITCLSLLQGVSPINRILPLVSGGACFRTLNPSGVNSFCEERFPLFLPSSPSPFLRTFLSPFQNIPGSAQIVKRSDRTNGPDCPICTADTASQSSNVGLVIWGLPGGATPRKARDLTAPWGCATVIQLLPS